MVSVSVSELRDDPNAAAEWDHDVRPKLERNRPDHGWSWQSWYRFTLLPLRARRGFALRVNRNVGGLVLSNPRSHLLTNREQPASYVWFMSAAPDAPVDRIGRGLFSASCATASLPAIAGVSRSTQTPAEVRICSRSTCGSGSSKVPKNVAGYPVQGAISRLRNQQPNDVDSSS